MGAEEAPTVVSYRLSPCHSRQAASLQVKALCCKHRSAGRRCDRGMRSRFGSETGTAHLREGERLGVYMQMLTGLKHAIFGLEACVSLQVCYLRTRIVHLNADDNVNMLEKFKF